MIKLRSFELVKVIKADYRTQTEINKSHKQMRDTGIHAYILIQSNVLAAFVKLQLRQTRREYSLSHRVS